MSPALADRFFTTEPLGNPPFNYLAQVSSYGVGICVKTENANLSNGVQTEWCTEWWPHSIGQNKARFEGWRNRSPPFDRRSCKVFVIYHSKIHVIYHTS